MTVKFDLEELVRFLPEAVVVVGLDGRISLANERAAVLVGLRTSVDLIGRPGVAFVSSRPGGSPDSLMDRILQEGPAYDLQYVIERPDGTCFDALVCMAPLVDRNGDNIGVVSVVRDVTEQVEVRSNLQSVRAELQEQQRRLKAILDTTGAAISVVDTRGGIIYGNAVWEQMFGYCLDEVRGERPSIATHPDDVELGDRLLEELLSGRRDGYRIEKRFYKKDGSLVWTDLSATAQRNPDGQLEACVGVLLDITERKANEERLRALEERLADAERQERKRIAAELHDGVAQTMQALRIKLGFLEPMLEAEQLSLLAEVEDLWQKAIAQLRELTASLSYTILYDLGLPFALKGLANELRKISGFELAVSAGPDKVDWSMVPDSASEAAYRSLREVAFNSLKHSNSDSAWVRVEAGAGRLDCVFEDGGCGFDAGAERTETGLGLVLVRKLIERENGSFELWTAPGRGCRVRMVLPYGHGAQ